MKKLLLLLFLIPNLVMGESYLCIAEAAGGVRYLSSQKIYESKKFAKERKFIFKKEQDNWTVKEFGNTPEPIQRCDDQIVNGKIIGVQCNVIGGDYILNFKALRYRYIHHFGWLPPRDGGDTDDFHVEVGKCSSI
jgi:hypothetical protein